MCGDSESGGTQYEGLLYKKSHHLPGVWKLRFFKFDGNNLRYWKDRKSYCNPVDGERQRARGEIQIAGNHVVAGKDNRGNNHAIIISSARSRFDEELLAKDEAERDRWVGYLSGATHKHRIIAANSRSHDDQEQFLMNQDIWPVLEDAVAAALRRSDVSSQTSAVPEDAVASSSSAKVHEAILAHCRINSVLLRSSETVLQPRQGKLIRFSRKLTQKLRIGGTATPEAVEACEERWLVLLSARPLIQGVSPVNNRFVSHLAEPDDLPVAFEHLYAYASPEAPYPELSLPLLNCQVDDEVQRCEDGHFWSVRVEEEDMGEIQKRVWTLVVETQHEAELWRHAISVSCAAAQAREQGLKRTATETLQGYLVNPALWKQCMADALADAKISISTDSVLSVISNGSTQSGFEIGRGANRTSFSGGMQGTFNGLPGRPSQALEKDAAIQCLDRVLNVCDDVWSEATDVLDAALQPPKDDAEEQNAELVLDAALLAALQSSPPPDAEVLPDNQHVLGAALQAPAPTENDAEKLGAEVPPDSQSVLDSSMLSGISSHTGASPSCVSAQTGSVLDARMACPSSAKDIIHRDVCEAVLNAAIDPAIACVGQCWARWNPVFSPAETRRLLKWLVACQAQLHSLGVVFAPLDQAISGVAVDLSLRMGKHLRKMTREMLVTELRGWSPQNKNGRSGSPEALNLQSTVMSNLPVDFFCFVNACLAADMEQPVLLLRMCSQRVAKFMVYELQSVLLGWLFSTQQEVWSELLDKKQTRGSPASAVLSPRVRQWLFTATGLANSFPNFQEQCMQLNATPIYSSQSFVEESDPMERIPDPLGESALPREWLLEAEIKRFVAMTDGFLWAMCDVISAKWRFAVLTEPPVLIGSAPRHSTPIGVLLKTHLDGPLQTLRNALEESRFVELLPKLFHLCLASYLARLSRGLWFQTARPGDRVVMTDADSIPEVTLKNESEALCSYFRNLSSDMSGATIGDTGLTYNWMLAVWRIGRWNPADQIIQELPDFEALKPLLELMLAGFKAAPASALKPSALPLERLLKRFSECTVEVGRSLANFYKSLFSPFDDIPEHVLEDNCTTQRPLVARCTPLPASPPHSPKRRLPEQRHSFPASSSSSSSRKKGFARSLFGASDESELPGPPLARRPTAVAVPVPAESVVGVMESRQIFIASSGEWFEDKIQDKGTFGISCSILRLEQDDYQAQARRIPRRPSSASMTSSPSVCSQEGSTRCASEFGDNIGNKNIWADVNVPLRRRWIQLVREPDARDDQPKERFEILRGCFLSEGSTPLEVYSLIQLEDVFLPDGETTMLHLTFSKEMGVVHFALCFDSPLDCLRARLILESWTAHNTDEHRRARKVVVLSTDTSKKPLREVAAGSWGAFSGRLTCDVLDKSLGHVWEEVHPSLCAIR